MRDPTGRWLCRKRNGAPFFHLHAAAAVFHPPLVVAFATVKIFEVEDDEKAGELLAARGLKTRPRAVGSFWQPLEHLECGR